jgi:hypothetical protein
MQTNRLTGHIDLSRPNGKCRINIDIVVSWLCCKLKPGESEVSCLGGNTAALWSLTQEPPATAQAKRWETLYRKRNALERHAIATLRRAR